MRAKKGAGRKGDKLIEMNLESSMVSDKNKKHEEQRSRGFESAVARAACTHRLLPSLCSRI